MDDIRNVEKIVISSRNEHYMRWVDDNEVSHYLSKLQKAGH